MRTHVTTAVHGAIRNAPAARDGGSR